MPFFFFLSFRAAPAAYGGSQARDPIRAVAAGLHHRHSNTRSELQARQCRILHPLSEARDRTHILMVPSRIRFHCAMVGTPGGNVFKKTFLTKRKERQKRKETLSGEMTREGLCFCFITLVL